MESKGKLSKLHMKVTVNDYFLYYGLEDDPAFTIDNFTLANCFTWLGSMVAVVVHLGFSRKSDVVTVHFLFNPLHPGSFEWTVDVPHKSQ